jgi:hypothetical protein
VESDGLQAHPVSPRRAAHPSIAVNRELLLDLFRKCMS